MDGRYNERIILKNEENLADGHRVQYDFVVDNLATRELYVLDQDFFTRSGSNSTSWKFRMEIRPVGVNDIVNIPIILTRFDTMNGAVNASINVSLSNNRGETISGVPRNFVKSRMVSGNELIGYIAGSLQSSELRISINKMLTVRAIVEIRDCHSVFNPEPAANFATRDQLIRKR